MDVQVIILVVVLALAFDDACVVVVGVVVGDTLVVVVVVVLAEEVGADGIRGNNGAVGIQRVVDEPHIQRGDDSSIRTTTSINHKWRGGGSCGFQGRWSCGDGGLAHFQD